MIELIFADRCTGCNACVRICPTNVLEPGKNAPPAIARQEDCQTCFLCELYCEADALYVAPNCDEMVAVDAGAIAASGLLGQFRRDSGWHEWAGQSPNLHWRMGELFARAKAG
ncbi:4Fe-4S dicluster domain-containing protein [Nitrospirillum pindoramense]|uniref:NAD-dependent dihydropyrimidine dehydrogenase PreA subunit n=1 Tax=Nitrospirillum amazonense TaxID=28077 RepID=A0A560GLM9_9PROT|nr:ferredoxin family protein [Nitrospirillum amazonense]TWB34619.1 NAD-dependent dihydropyrimidine dehydrogenase PreA subunit [Nitrospirillum amazonense]